MFLYLESPSSICIYTFSAYTHILECDKYIDMESLYFSFREFFSIDAMFFAEWEMDSELSLMEVNIREGSIAADGRIQSESELSHHHLSLILDDPVIELLECWRKLRRGKYSSVFDNKLEWNTMIHRKVLIRKCFDETCSMYRSKIDSFCKYLSDRKCTSFIQGSAIVTSVSSDRLYWTKCQDSTILRNNLRR